MRWLALVMVLSACKSKTEAPKPAPVVPKVAPADATVTGDLVAQLQAIRAKLELPGIAAATWRDGKLVTQAAVGLRKAGDTGHAVTETDLWHLGSNTKAMTAALIGIYIDRGTLRWTDTIADLLGPTKAKIDPAYKKVTLDQLLRHEGGAAKDPPPVAWKQLWDDGAKPDARSTFVNAIIAAPPAGEVGKFVYSNTNYMIAGAMLEAKLHKPWEQLIHDELWAKLDMKTCGFGAPGTKGLVDQPLGHDAGGTPIEPGPAGDNPPGLGPAGTAHCSLADYGKFLNVFATGSPAIITPETMQHLTTAREAGPMGYAGGWMVVSKKDTMLLHSGSNTMWYLTAIVIPSKHFAFVVATNKGEPKIEESLEALMKSQLE